VIWYQNDVAESLRRLGRCATDKHRWFGSVSSMLAPMTCLRKSGGNKTLKFSGVF